jgi:hypothetical protein
MHLNFIPLARVLIEVAAIEKANNISKFLRIWFEIEGLASSSPFQLIIAPKVAGSEGDRSGTS